MRGPSLAELLNDGALWLDEFLRLYWEGEVSVWDKSVVTYSSICVTT